MQMYVIRSDTGDGGWSIHAKEQEDEDGIAPVLASGTAELIDGEWNRPNAEDWQAAKAKAANH